MERRRAGVLLHPTSLPGSGPVGDLGPGADAFLGWAADAGVSLWQVLPLGPTAFGNSPYGGLSAFAGNPLLVSPEELVREGLLPADGLAGAAKPGESPVSAPHRIDWGAAIPWKERTLRASFAHFLKDAPSEPRRAFESFREDPANAFWLADWSLFAALKAHFGGRAFPEWGRELASFDPETVRRARVEEKREIAFHEYVQFLFSRQWARVRAKANLLGIEVMGDVPIYVALDSADVWSQRRLFTVDAAGRPETVAGVPPDYFSETGQLWGNPLFRWDRVRKEGFSWWVERTRVALKLFDLVRLDHFRGFSAFWEVAAGAEDAVNGRWVDGPGEELFSALERALGGTGRLPLVAEDLGVITPEVEELLRATGFPGMKVLQFAFEGDDNEHMPHRHVANSVVYTGTHDNATAREWWESVDAAVRARTREFLGSCGTEVAWDLVRAAYTSVADRAVVPLQDLFGLGAEARMNTPGKGSGNWSWRADAALFTSERAARLRRLARLTGRAAPARRDETAAAAAGDDGRELLAAPGSGPA